MEPPIAEPIRSVCGDIARLFSPERMILFSVKRSVSGAVRSFKVCVILDAPRVPDIEKRIYLEIDSRLPFDVLVYTPAEWAALVCQKDSFASTIIREGTVVYEAGPKSKRRE